MNIKKTLSHFTRLVSTRFSIVTELFQFMWKEKLWWMIPLMALLLVVGLLVIFAQASPIAPFLYTIF